MPFASSEFAPLKGKLMKSTNNLFSYQKTVDVFFCVLILFGFYLRFAWGNDFTYSMFTDRDLMRGFQLWDDFQHLGSESMYHLARTPGGFIAYFFNFLGLINPSANFIHTVVVLMDCLALALIPVLFRRFLGLSGALAFAAFYGATLYVLEELWKFWNPSITPSLVVLMYWQFLSYFEDRKTYHLLIAFALIGIAAQFHMSFYSLIPMAVAFIYISGGRPTLFAWSSVVGVFLLLLMPYLLIDGANGFFNLKHLITVPDIAQSVPTTLSGPFDAGSAFDQTILVLQRITGGRSFPNDTLPTLISGIPYLSLGAAIVFNIGLISLLIFGGQGIWALSRGRSVWLSERFGRIEWGLVVLFLASIAIAFGTANNNQGRYLIPIALPGLLLIGVGFRNFWQNFETIKKIRLIAFLPVFLIAILAAKYIAIMVHYNVSPRETTSSYAVKEEIVDILKSEFGWTNEDIDFKVAQWIYDGVHATPGFTFADENAALMYIARATKDVESVSRYGGCALVQLWGRRSDRPPPEDLTAFIKANPLRQGFRVEKTVTRGDIRVLGYRTDNGNCVRNIGNRYLLTSEEKITERLLEGVPAGQARATRLSEAGWRLSSRLPNGSPIAVDLQRGETGVQVNIHSNSLRGLAPSSRIEQSSLDDYSLKFSLLSGNRVIELESLHPLGKNSLYAPWRMGTVELPQGNYKIELYVKKYTEHISYSRTKIKRKSGPHSILLSNNFTWP